MQLSDSTLRRKLRFDQAKRFLLDYRAPGEAIDDEDERALIAKLNQGRTPEDAAEQLQAERLRP